MMNYPSVYQRQQNGIIWVQGIEGAKAYQLMPNSNIILMDSEQDGRFYIKTSDNVGMCNLRVFSYEEIDNTPQQVDTSQFVTKAELHELLEKLGVMNDEQPIPTAKRKQKSVITE